MASRPKPRRCKVCNRLYIHARNQICSRSCRLEYKSRQAQELADRHKVFNHFLPEDAEENRHGVWVPSPEEIQEKVAYFRAQYQIHGGGE